MYFLGDVHGEFKTYRWVLKNIVKDADSIQLGDFGIFDKYDLQQVEWLKPLIRHRVLPGNHDNPHLIQQISNCIGYYGSHNDIFWVGGGFSIDKESRTEGLDWWRDEELSDEKFAEIIQIYSERKPRIMLSHECPTAMKLSALDFVTSKKMTSRTEAALEKMFAIHQPDYWIFGHYHNRVERKILNTQFVALHEMKYGPIKQTIYEIPDLVW